MTQARSEAELAATVDAYREMLRMQTEEMKFVKAHVYRDLANRFGRDEGAFERRMQNISALYEQSGLGWVVGLKPQKNIGSAIKTRLLAMMPHLSEQDSVQLEVEVAAKEAEQSHAFDPVNVQDARKRVVASIVRRRGQSAFRKGLLAVYGTRCAITGCDQPEVLEAAHIHPYMGEYTHALSNGLLLRADLHTLFDLYLIAIEPQTLRIRLAPQLRPSLYDQYEGMPLNLPLSPSFKASVEALQWHADQCTWFKSPIESSV